MSLSFDVITRLQGKTLATAESCTGGMLGAALTAVPGSSKVYKGGIISYTNEIKQKMLGVDAEVLKTNGAVSAQVARAMAEGARMALNSDIAVSVTGLAGPDGDEYGNFVGTVFIGYADVNTSFALKFRFFGSREEVRNQACEEALEMILELNP